MEATEAGGASSLTFLGGMEGWEDDPLKAEVKEVVHSILTLMAGRRPEKEEASMATGPSKTSERSISGRTWASTKVSLVSGRPRLEEKSAHLKEKLGHLL